MTRKRNSSRRRKISKRWKNTILNRQRNECTNTYGICGNITFNSIVKPEYDHIIALRFNGPDTLSNLQALCGSCHRYKSNLETTCYYELLSESIDTNTSKYFREDSILKLKKKKYHVYHLVLQRMKEHHIRNQINHITSMQI